MISIIFFQAGRQAPGLPECRFLYINNQDMETATTLPPVFGIYYTEARRLKNELDFYQTEVIFLHRLLDQQLRQGCDDAQTTRLANVLTDLFEWSSSGNMAAALLMTQIKALTNIVKEGHAADLAILERQQPLRNHVDDLRCEYLQLKSGLYNLAGGLLQDARNVALVQ